MNLVVLDRDGVINEDSDAYIKSVAEWIPITGSIEAIARLNRAGYTVAVASNQSGIARGLFDEQTLAAMHARLDHLLNEQGGAVDTIVYCPHGPDDQCSCRKPKPGLLHRLEDHYGRSLQGVPIVGDSYRDLEAAWAVGARPVLVLTGKGRRTLSAHPELKQRIEIYPDLAAFVDHLLAQSPAPQD